MSIYKKICDEVQQMVREITRERAFGARFAVIVNEDDGISKPRHWEIVQHVEDGFFENIYIIAKKLRELLDKEKNGNDEPIERPEACGIKGMRDEALMNLYKHYNRLTALDKIGYAESEMMRVLIVDIEKLEHARHMEESDEIAKMSIEKLEKLAAPIPEIRMSGIPNEFRTVLDKCEKKEGAENDD